jgi:hypothetical protein
MRLLGEPILTLNFKWTPAMLLAMINEIDKICPEEDLHTQQNLDLNQAPLTQQNDNLE